MFSCYGHSGIEPHYHIVVHKTFQNDLVLVYTTKNLDGTYKACRRDELDLLPHMEPTTYIEIPIGTTAALSDLCAIDCNKAHLKSEESCIKGADYDKMEGKMPSEILERIKAAMPNSSTVRGVTIKALTQ